MTTKKGLIQDSTKITFDINEAIGFLITFLNTTSTNYKCFINFGDGSQSLSVIGNTFIFNEFNRTGMIMANITAVSIKDEKKMISNQILLNINKFTTVEPMYSIKLSSFPVGDSVYTVKINFIASGGLTYTCLLNYGDGSDSVMFKSTSRLTTVFTNYTYQAAGVYNVTLSCQSDGLATSSLRDWQLVYVVSNHNLVLQNPLGLVYAMNNFNQMYLNRAGNTSILLMLPFKFCAANLIFNVIDLLQNEVILEWTCNMSQVAANGNIIISLSSALLSDQNENYLGVVTLDSINVATYLLTWQDNLIIPPRIQLMNGLPVFNKPTIFQVTLPVSYDAILYIDFGDNQTLIYQIADVTQADNDVLYTLNLQHYYVQSSNLNNSIDQEFLFTVKIVNHLSFVEASLNLIFQLELSSFTLDLNTNVITDVNQQPVILTLSSLVTNKPVFVNEINFSFDLNNHMDSIVYQNYTFDASNNFKLIVYHTYSSYGIHNVLVNCSNSISSQILTAYVKVGTNIRLAEGYIMNPYANVNTDVNFYVHVDGGNGYNIDLIMGNSADPVSLKWNTLHAAHDAVGKNNKINLTQTGFIVITAQYTAAGTFSPFVNVSNLFGYVILKFCSPVKIQQSNLNKLNGAQLQLNESCLINRNLAITSNNEVCELIEFMLFGNKLFSKIFPFEI